ncbi:MAG: hypothetical protein ACI4RA_06190 [Kiritimatiellia bacterium]
MNKVFHIIVSGIAGVGLVDGLAAVYQTRPPVKMPRILTSQEAMSADKSALSADFARVYKGIADAYSHEAEVFDGHR